MPQAPHMLIFGLMRGVGQNPRSVSGQSELERAPLMASSGSTPADLARPRDDSAQAVPAGGSPAVEGCAAFGLSRAGAAMLSQLSGRLFRRADATELSPPRRASMAPHESVTDLLYPTEGAGLALSINPRTMAPSDMRFLPRLFRPPMHPAPRREYFTYNGEVLYRQKGNGLEPPPPPYSAKEPELEGRRVVCAQEVNAGPEALGVPREPRGYAVNEAYPSPAEEARVWQG